MEPFRWKFRVVSGVLQYAITDRDLDETMLKPRFDAIQTLPNRWVQHYLAKLEKSTVPGGFYRLQLAVE